MNPIRAKQVLSGLFSAVLGCAMLFSCQMTEDAPAAEPAQDGCAERSAAAEPIAPDTDEPEESVPEDHPEECFLTASGYAVSYASGVSEAQEFLPETRAEETDSVSVSVLAAEPAYAVLPDAVAVSVGGGDAEESRVTVEILSLPDTDVPAKPLFYHVPDAEAALCKSGQEQYLAEQKQDARRRRRIRQAELRAAKKAREEARAEALRRRTPGYSEDFVAGLTEEEQKEARTFYEEGYVFYRQNWSSMDALPYGDDGFGLCGCGPTCVAAIVSNLAKTPVTPEDMRQYAIKHRCYLPHRGTTYDFMISVPEAYGLKVTNLAASDEEGVRQALKDGKLVLATMGPGDFTLGAHYLLYRGITREGKILIADSYSYEFSRREWDYEDLYAQLKTGYWVYEKAE